MTSHALLVTGLTLAVVGVGTSTANAQKPSDECALLQPAEIQALAGTAKVGPGKPNTDPLGSRVCVYEWGTGGNVPSGKSLVQVTVTPVAKAFPGLDASVVRQALLASAKPPNAAVIPGIGDAAIYESTRPIEVKTTALAKGTMLIVSFQSSDARAKRDQVIALLKAAAGRL